MTPNCNIQELLEQMGNPTPTKDQQREMLQKALEQKMLKKKSLEYQKAVLEKNVLLIENHPGGAKAGLKALIENDITGETKYLNLETEIKVRENEYKRRALDIYEELAGSWGGQKLTKQQKKLHSDINGELHGFDTGNPKAKSLAEKIQSLKEEIRQDVKDVYKDSYEVTLQRYDWLNDPEKSIKLLKDTLKDPSTAEMVFKDTQTKMELHEKIEPFDFKDAASAARFEEAMGNNPLSNLDVFIKRNSEIITDAKIIGGKRNFELLLKHAKKFDEEFPKEQTLRQKTIEQRTKTLSAQYRVASGEVDAMGDASIPALAKGMSITRTLSNIGALGNVIWSSIGDIGQVNFANSQMGISRFKTYTGIIQSLFSNKNERELAELGYGVEHLQTQLQNRFSEDGMGSGFVEKTSDFVMFISGIQSWSRSVKLSAMKLQHMNLKNKIQDSIKTGKLDESLEWLNWTQDEVNLYKDQDWDDFVNWPDELRLKVIRTVDGRTKNAVLEPGSATRVFTTGGQQKGTVAGEGIRSFTQVTSFVFESFNRNILNDVTMKKGPKSLLLLRAEQAAVMITLGIVGDEIKNALYNRTPEKGSPLNPGSEEDQMKYWAAKTLKYMPQSTLLEAANKFNPYAEPGFNQGKISAGMGVDNLLKIGTAIGKDIRGKNDNRSETWKAVNRAWNPLNIFYTRALYNHYVRDSISRILDPEFDRKQRKAARSRKKKYGQEQLIEF